MGVPGESLAEQLARFWNGLVRSQWPQEGHPMSVIRGRVSMTPVVAAVALILGAAVRPVTADPTTRLQHWNRVAIDASGLDHTPVSPDESRVFGEQLGPTRASRAMAI